MPDSSRLRDWFRQNTAIGRLSDGRPWTAAANAFGSAVGGPLLGYALGKLADKGYERQDRNNYVPSSPQPQTPGNNAGLALGMTDWGGSSGAFNGSRASGDMSGPFTGSQADDSMDQYGSFVINKEGSAAVPNYLSGSAPLMSGWKPGNGQGTGGGIGFGWGASQDSFDQGMIMDALGMSGALGGGGPNIDSPMTWMRRAVK